MNNKKIWFAVSISCLCVSILSLFLSIITYKPEVGGHKYSFSIIDLIGKSPEFDEYILRGYKGPVVWDITGTITAILAIFVVAGIGCSIIGLITLRAQRPNTWQFVLTIVGLIAVACPSIILIICVLGYGKYYTGTIGFGIAPIITPIAMITCIFVVIRRKNKVAEELQHELEQRGLIRRAGDL